jgi:hypothetical protein
LGLAVAALLCVGPAGAQGADPGRDASAVAALERMGTYLRSLKAFQVAASISTEDVLDDGLKAQYASEVDLVAVQPDRFRARVTSDRADRMFFYDGKGFTFYARRLNYYATAQAPATIRELADRLDERYGIDVPLVDLFRFGPESALAVTKAVDLGPSEVAGTTCRHYAFRQEGIDWQIWIQEGDFPLPRKLVITTTTDAARPQYAVDYAWNLAPSVNDAAFRFVPPPGAQRIVFAADAAAIGR